MAEALTVLAEEMGRLFGLVWSGVGVAMRLNNQVMATVLKVTTRIVQLLLLLTHKAADLLSLLLTDLLLFLGDIGNAVMATASALRTAITIIFAFINGVAISIMSAAMYSCQLVHASYLAVLSGMVGAVAQIGNLFTALKHAFILFGSSVVFILSLVPNIVCLVFSGLVHLCSYTFLSCSKAVSDAWHSAQHMASVCFNSTVDFFSDIPCEAFVGVAAGVGLMVGLKYVLFYMMENMILIPDIPSPTMVLRRRVVRWYMGMVRGMHQRPPTEPETEEEDLDDANDENGNDNNDNVPDLNLPENQPPFGMQMNPPPLIGGPPPPVILNPPPLIGGPPPPLIAQPQARRPLIRQQVRLQESGSEDPLEDEVRRDRPVVDKLLYQELEEERERLLCVVCQDRAKSIILLPCRHLCLCDVCCAAITARGAICPICRRHIRETMMVFH